MATSPKTKNDCVSMTKEKKRRKKFNTLVFHFYYNIFIIIEVARIWKIVRLLNQNFLFVVLFQHFCYYLIEIAEGNQQFIHELYLGKSLGSACFGVFMYSDIFRVLHNKTEINHSIIETYQCFPYYIVCILWSEPIKRTVELNQDRIHMTFAHTVVHC